MNPGILRRGAPALLVLLILSCSAPTAPDRPVLDCLDPTEFDVLRLLGPLLLEHPRRHGASISYLAGSTEVVNGRPAFVLGRIDTSGTNVREFLVESVGEGVGSSRPYIVAHAPYDRNLVLVQRGSGRTPEVWRIDDAQGTVVPTVPEGWDGPRLPPLARLVGWLAGSTPGNDSIAITFDQDRLPGVFLPQRDSVVVPRDGFVPFSDDEQGRHRLTLRRDFGIDELRVDGIALPPLVAGDRLEDARWSPDGRRLLLGFASDRETLRYDYWIVELGDPVSARRFATSPSCLPILELEFLTDSRFIASAIDDVTGQILLYELTLDGHVVRRLTAAESGIYARRARIDVHRLGRPQVESSVH